MELEKLEVLLELNTRQIQEAIDKVAPQINGLMNKIENSTGTKMRQTEDNLDISDSLTRLEKTLNAFTNTFNKQMETIANSAQKGATNVTKNMEAGMKQTRTKAGKEVDLMVNDINAKLGQAKAAQAKISDLSAKRAIATQEGDGGQVINYDRQIANAEKQMTSYRNSAIELARGMKAEFDAVPSSLSRIARDMDSNESRIENMKRRIANMNKVYESQRKPVGSFKDGWTTTDTDRSTNTMAKIQAEQAKMNKLVTANDQLMRAYSQTQDRAKALKSAIGQLGNTLDSSTIKTGNAALGMQNVANASDRAKNVWSRFGGLFNRTSNNIAHGLRRTGSVMNTFFGSLNQQLNRTSKNTSKLNKQSNVLLGGWQRTMYMLASQLFVFTLLYRGIMFFGAGLWNSLKTNDEFANSLNQIKVNLLTAFYPIYTAVMPAINAMMQGLAKLTGVMASFIATMFGTNYEAAKQGAAGLYENVKALEDTSKGADKAKEKIKKLQNSLMGFDEINRIGLAVDTGADDSLTPEERPTNFAAALGTYTTPQWLLDFVANAKKVLSELFKPIQAAWDKHGKAVMDSFKYMLGEIWKLVKAIGQDFMDVWTNGTGERTVSNILKLLTVVFNIIGDITRAFREAWQENNRGEILIQAIFNLLNSVLELIISIGEAFRVAWNDGSGKRIMADILEILTNIIQGFSNLTDNIRVAWETNDLGVSIMNTLLDIVENVTSAVNDASQAFKDWTQTVDFTPLMIAIDTLLKAFEPLTADVADGLVWIFENALLPLASWTIEDLLPAFLNTFADALDLLNVIIDALKPTFGWLWDSFLQPLAEWTGGAIISVLEDIGNAFQKIGGFISEHQKGFGDFVVAFGAFVLSMKVLSGLKTANDVMRTLFLELSGGLTGKAGVLKVLSSGLGKIITSLGGPWVIGIAIAIAAGVLLYRNWDDIKAAAERFHEWFKGAEDAIGEKVSEVWGKIKTGTRETWNDFSTKITGHLNTAATNAKTKTEEIRSVVSSKWDSLKTNTGVVWDNVAQKVSTKSSEAKTNASNLVQGLKDNISSRWSEIKSNTQTTWDAVQGKVSTQSGNAKNNATTAFSTMKTNISNYMTDIKRVTSEAFDKVVGWASGLGDKIANGLNKGVESIRKAAGNIGNGMVSIIGRAVNGVIKGVNWVLDKVGAGDKKLSEWTVPKYARGTNAHMGGPAWVNDGPGQHYQEAFQLPNGETGLFPKQRNMMVNLPKGSKVLSGPETAKLIPRYAGGVGDWIKDKWAKTKDIAGDVFDYVKKPKELLGMAISKFVNLKDAMEPNLSIASGAVNTMATNAVGFLKEKLESAFASMQGSGTYAPSFNNPPFTLTAKFMDAAYRSQLGMNHYGVDYAAPIGTKIPAVNGGIVTAAGGGISGYGQWVKIRVAKDLEAIYGHISKWLVNVGDTVKAGQNIAEVGNEGWSTCPHLHYELRKNGQAVDPDTYGAKELNSGDWRSTIEKALQMNGLPVNQSYVNAWLRQVQSESGGNPRAVQNPQVDDINMRTGNPAKGLLQTIQSTFDAYAFPGHKDIFNGLDNALAAINYAKNRYGATGMLDVIGYGHGYENGGLVNRESYRVGEGNKKEIIIPLEKRQRALQLLEMTKEYLGVNDNMTLQIPEIFVAKPMQSVATNGGNVGVSSGGMNNMNDALLNSLRELMSDKNSNETVEVVLEMDGDRVGDAVIKRINRKTRQAGKSPLRQ